MCAASCFGQQAGIAVCWGANDFGECRPPPGVTFTKVAAGYHFSLGIAKDGSIHHWGNTQWNQNLVPGGSFIAISAGYDHGLALNAVGLLSAWGGGDDQGPGQQGQGTVPVDPQGENIYTAISAGEGFNLALRTNGTIFAWGWNASGQLNIPDNDLNAPGFVPYVAIDAGGHHGVALRADGKVRAWGGNPNNCSTQGIVPAQYANEKFIAVGAGHYSSWAIMANRTVIRWGCTGCNTDPPANIQGIAAFVDGGYKHAVGLTTDGSLRAWGSNCGNAQNYVLGQPNIVPPELANAVVISIAPGNSNEHNVFILAN